MFNLSRGPARQFTDLKIEINYTLSDNERGLVLFTETCQNRLERCYLATFRQMWRGSLFMSAKDELWIKEIGDTLVMSY
jgi:hypothetical protein